MESKIDFVIAWVDGSDPKWQADKEKFTGIKANVDACRYRDWDLLRYWFRGVEKFAPWVNRIHFVTYGHLPEWLNTEHPKLNIVNHKDFIPKQYLPTFNSHTIELNLHRIKGLEEQFVYFNDDIFLLGEVKPEDFFENGKARDTIALDALKFCSKSIAFIDANNVALLNDKFDKRRFIKSNWKELLNPIIGIKKVIKNILLMPFPFFTGFYNHHLSSSFLKSSYEYVWNCFPKVLDDTCRSKIREKNNVNQWLIKDVQIIKGICKNRCDRFGIRINLKNTNVDECIDIVKKKQFRLLCINDNEDTGEIEKLQERLKEAFILRFPCKSEFER
ncbi:MAG: Stealth CR1 domain-containing protein [Phascolarctobacterium sp.]|nr:Stealth CR1 domain-containing protein [Phascolarctobacterium sp.]